MDKLKKILMIAVFIMGSITWLMIAIILVKIISWL